MSNKNSLASIFAAMASSGEDATSAIRKREENFAFEVKELVEVRIDKYKLRMYPRTSMKNPPNERMHAFSVNLHAAQDAEEVPRKEALAAVADQMGVKTHYRHTETTLMRELMQN